MREKFLKNGQNIQIVKFKKRRVVMSGKIHSDHHISGPDNRSIMETYTKKVAKVEIEKDEKSTNKYAEIIRESLKKRAINTGIGAVVGAGTGAYKHASDWAHRTARKK